MRTHLCIHGEVFTKTQKIVDWIVSRTGWPIVTDRDLLIAAGQRFNMPAERLERFMKSPEGLLTRLTSGTERAMAYMKSVLVEKLAEGTTIFHGTMGLPTTIQMPQVLNVLVTAEPRFRVQRALHATTASERQARNIIDRRDRREFQWCRHVFGGDQFDAGAYGLVVPSDRLDTEAAGRLILEQLVQTEIAARDNETDLLDDFKMASQIQVLLSKSGYHVSVDAQKGRVRLTVNRPVLFLNRLEKKLKQRAFHVKGVQQVETRAGRYFFQTDIYRRFRFELPVEVEFRNFTQCRRRLHNSAAAHFPALSRRQTQSDQAHAVQQQLASIASP